MQRLEKLIEINKNFEGPPSRLKGYGDMQDDGGFGDTGLSGQGFNLNEQVNQELMQHQMKKGQYGVNRMSNNGPLKNRGYNPQQREFEEAMELDRILEEERRQQSLQAFAAKTDKTYNDYISKLETPNIKNASKGMMGIFGMGDTGGAAR